jgi:hypothetical protein
LRNFRRTAYDRVVLCPSATVDENRFAVGCALLAELADFRCGLDRLDSVVIKPAIDPRLDGIFTVM